ncbi:hypothetical protein OSW16_05355 [Pseudomonas putida]|uniref:hypothetical protein n=1 Tax=Pseudomonas putida TaxID=303 RepID=UPI002271D7D0|nr:hypothetical protein [Pseudomonas putida]WAB99084.1 hypothetical protein OSW16_05355 [Pseudomonas putida]
MKLIIIGYEALSRVALPLFIKELLDGIKSLKIIAPSAKGKKTKVQGLRFSIPAYENSQALLNHSPSTILEVLGRPT